MNKILVTYFTHSGNTKVVADKISTFLVADIHEIETANTYPVKYNLVVDQAKVEFNEGFRPELVGKIDNFDEYNVIVIGYPIWWYTCPMAIYSFLEQYDFTGKTILPFCTHEGSALSSSVEDIKEIVPNANVEQGLAIRGRKVHEVDANIKAWLSKVV